MKRALSGIGILALVVVVLLAAVPAGLSPVGIAAGQATNQTANQTQNTANSSGSVGANTTANVSTAATVAFTNQTTNGTAVTISSATLPKGGFIVIHGPAFARQGIISGTALTVSGYLKPGTYQNITVHFANGVPGAASNSSKFEGVYASLSAVLYQDTNGNRQFDYIQTLQNDTPYRRNGSRVFDPARVVTQQQLARKNQTSASVRFADQETNGSTVTVASVRLPNGGFVVIHNSSYLPPENDPFSSAIGVTAYLEPGRHTNVTVPLLQGSVTTNQTLVAVLYRDTNNNRRYDYVASGGIHDLAYVNRSGKQAVIVNDTATVSVTDAGTATASTTTSTTTPLDTATPFRVTNLSVSNRTAYVGHKVIVTAWIENPTQHRLTDDLAVATAGEIIETKPAALFPRERRAVKFAYTYGAPGRFIIKVGNQTEQIRIVPEGAPLTTMAANGSEASAEGDGGQSQSKSRSQSGGGWGSLLWIGAGALVLGLVGVVIVVILNRM